MAGITWDQLTRAPVHDRVAMLLASAPVRDALTESIDRAQRVLAADRVESRNLLDVDGAAQLLAFALAQTSVWELNSQTDTFAERRTSDSTWEKIARCNPKDAREGYRLTFADMWDNMHVAGQERSAKGELSGLDEFVLEGSCKGWAVRRPTGSETKLPSDANVAIPIETPARDIRTWLFARYDEFVQKILCDNYSRRSWWREFSTPSEASVDFWGFYAAARWHTDALFRARYLGHAAMTTYLFQQAMAWATQHERQRIAGMGPLGDGSVVDGSSATTPLRSTSAFLETAQDCIDRHKSNFGEGVQAWVELVLAMCTSPRDAMKRIPAERRGARSTAFKDLKKFREAVARCIESQSVNRSASRKAAPMPVLSAGAKESPDE